MENLQFQKGWKMRKNKILIVDDVELNRDMLTVMLGEKYDFVYAENGVEAVEKLGGIDDIDLMLLDVNMPKMDGFEVLRIMKERNWTEDFPVIIISAEDSNECIEEAYNLGVADYLSRPFRGVVVRRRVENTLAMYQNQKRLVNLIGKQIYEKERINNSMINIFSNIIELRNHESGSHTLNVQNITHALLESLAKKTNAYNLTNTRIALISSLSALHDIGKIKIPESILNKPGKLDADEWELMKTHTTEGEDIISRADLDKDSEFIKTARIICRSHHEKYDGKGYPDGLKGDEIPIEAQVVSLADVYDALTSERCYKTAYTHEVAVKMINDGECGAFNPLLLECFNEVSDKLRAIKGATGKGEKYEDLSGADKMADELLKTVDLPQENATRRMLENEKAKKEFFMGCASGIQVEYDKLLHKVTFISSLEKDENKKKVDFATRDSANKVLPTKYWDEIREKLIKTTKENPIVETDIEFDMNGKLSPYHARLMAIWPETGGEYISVIGHIVPIK